MINKQLIKQKKIVKMEKGGGGGLFYIVRNMRYVDRIFVLNNCEMV